jgi:hypothetical protein
LFAHRERIQIAHQFRYASKTTSEIKKWIIEVTLDDTRLSDFQIVHLARDPLGIVIRHVIINSQMGISREMA